MTLAICCAIVLVFLSSEVQTQENVNENQEMCFPFRQNPVVRQPEVNRQGRPGKTLPRGPSGPRGFPGDPGKCGCNSSEVEQLRAWIHTLEASLREKISSVTDFLGAPYLERNCYIGLKDGRVKDNQISASSIYASVDQASHGRLDFINIQPAWAARRLVAGEWLQIDLKTPVKVIGVITQGKANTDQWITSFKFAYGNATSSVQIIQDENGNDLVFQGNRDRTTHVINRFSQPIWARYFRVVAHTWHGHISLRMELLTC